jgi:hypothetical protein
MSADTSLVFGHNGLSPSRLWPPRSLEMVQVTGNYNQLLTTGFSFGGRSNPSDAVRRAQERFLGPQNRAPIVTVAIITESSRLQTARCPMSRRSELRVPNLTDRLCVSPSIPG